MTDLFRMPEGKKKKGISRNNNFKYSGWFEMNPDQFCDSITSRYGRVSVDFPSHYDAGNETFDVTHALN